MKPRSTRIVLLISAVLFALLFSEKSLGINLVIYEALVLAWLFLSQQIKLSTVPLRWMFGAQVLTLGFTVWHHSTWSYFIHFLVSFLFVGTLLIPNVRSLLSVCGQAFLNLIDSFKEFFRVGEKVEKEKAGFFSISWKVLRIILWPLVILLVFILLYSMGNPRFGAYVLSLLNSIEWFFQTLFDLIDLPFLFTLLTGCLVGVYLFYRRADKDLIESDLNAPDVRVRKKSRHNRFRMRALLQEYRSGIFLFTTLNIALLVLNVLDIDQVWLHFKWEGQYLRDFVYQGTFALLFSIILSLILVLYYFNGNLSFFSKNKKLKVLCYIWLGQNIFLALSAGLRNWYYIQYYSLAYKRIAVAVFLLLAIYGLYSVLVKIRHNKSAFYLLRKNAVAWVAVLVLSAGFNWDRIIASFNFERGGRAFVHLDFLAKLSDSALPELDQPMERLNEIHVFQETIFFIESGLSSDSYRHLYVDAKKYAAIIEHRKRAFVQRWEVKSWLEWNAAEAQAYAALVH